MRPLNPLLVHCLDGVKLHYHSWLLDAHVVNQHVKTCGALFYHLITQNSSLNVVMYLYYFFGFNLLVQHDLYSCSKLLVKL